MKTGIFITARLGSKRLPKKHLRSVGQRPIIKYLIDRINNEFRDEILKGQIQLLITTSDEVENKEFEKIDTCVPVFYGSPYNIPLRHLQAAEYYFIQNIISVDGDDILCSTDGMRKVFNGLISGKEYVKTSGLPLGMNSMGYKVCFLRDSLRMFEEKVLETGWGRIFDESKLNVVEFKIVNASAFLRFTLDYPEDLEFFDKLIQGFNHDFSKVSDQEIVDYVNELKLYELLKFISEQYWLNFNTSLNEEKIKK